jgi:hypothetical protein
VIPPREQLGAQWPATGYPSKKRRTGAIVAVVCSVLALLCMGGLAIAASVIDWPRARQSSPPPNAPDRAAGVVRSVLDKQRAALLSGDEAGYLAILDPSIDPDDKVGLSRQFRSLRAMKVVDWQDKVVTATEEGPDRWDMDLSSSACFVTAPCPEGQAVANTKWLIKGDAATMVDWQPGRQPHPWQLSELVANSGERTVVATTKDQAGKLPTVLREAEKAAKVADRYGGKNPPVRYVIYYAGRNEWRKWFGWDPPDWSAGVAVDVSDDRYEVVLNAEQMDSESMPAHLRHEMTHAATLPGKFHDGPNLWWLKEGIAELAEANGTPARDHPGIDGASAVLVASGGFEVKPPEDIAEEEAVDGAYAVAFLATRCLTERFGDEKFMQFFHAVVHEGKTEAQASPRVFGVDWAPLSSECLSYVRSTTG